MSQDYACNLLCHVYLQPSHAALIVWSLFNICAQYNNPNVIRHMFCSLLQVDVYGFRRLTYALEWMGIHALSIFVLITSNLAFIAIRGFYWHDPKSNIVSSVDIGKLSIFHCTWFSPYSFLVRLSSVTDSLDHYMFCEQVTWLLKFPMPKWMQRHHSKLIPLILILHKISLSWTCIFTTSTMNQGPKDRRGINLVTILIARLFLSKFSQYISPH